MLEKINKNNTNKKTINKYEKMFENEKIRAVNIKNYLVTCRILYLQRFCAGISTLYFFLEIKHRS